MRTCRQIIGTEIAITAQETIYTGRPGMNDNITIRIREIGIEVYNASVVMGVKSKKKIRRVKGAVGERVYPEAWLEMWFRDYDAKLSMEVYNKKRAKAALKKIKAK